MAVTESFLVNTNSFNAIIEALIELDESPDEVSDELLVSLGFESPSDLLVVHMLKELEMVTVDGKPTELYQELVNPETTDQAIATGILHAYTDLFEINPDFHKLQKEDIHKELNEYFDGRKTDLIIKYMTNTVHKLVTSAGLNNVQKAVDAYFEDKPETEEPVTADESSSPAEEIATSENGEIGTDTEGQVDDAEENNIENEKLEKEDKDVEEELSAKSESESDEETTEKSKKSANFDELPKVRQEEKGSKNIDDFFRSEEDENKNEDEIKESAESINNDIDEETVADTDTSDKNTASDQQENQDELSKADEDDEIENVEESQESLEQELMQLNMEPTNGLNKNGAETKENPMANLTNIPTDEKVEKAVIKKAELLYKLERFEDVLPAYNDVISYFDNSDKEHLKEAVAQAVINRVAVLNKLDREDDLLPALDEVINRFENSSVNEYYEEASMAMLQKAALLGDASHDMLLPLYNDIVDRLQNASNPKIKTQVDEVFVNRVDILMDEGSDDELLDAVDDLIKRFKDSQVHTGQLEQAMYKKAEILEGMDRNEEALEAYSEFLDKFGKTTEAV